MPDHVNAVLRAATPQDIEKLLELLTPPAEAGLILPRSRDELHKSIHCFTVAELDNRLVGCVARRDFGNGLVEIRSLVVDSAWQGKRLGSTLVSAAVKAAECDGAQRIFALTYHPRLFEHQGFQRVSKDLFPEKVWHDCAKCPKRDRCDEIALLKKMN